MRKRINFMEILGIICLISSSIWSLWRVFYGLDLLDTFYFACDYLYSGRVSVFMPLNQGLFVLINKICGNYIIAYRIFNWLFAIVPPIAIYSLVRTLDINWRGCGLFLTSVAIILMTSMNVNVFNGNSISALCIIGALISVFHVAEGRWKWCVGIFCCVLCGILTRFPNIIMIPIIVAMCGFVTHNFKDYLRMCGSLIMALVAYIGISALIFHGLGNYYDALHYAFSSTTNSTGSNHSLQFLMSEYLHSFKDIISDIKYLAILCIVPIITLMTTKRWLINALLVLFVFAILIFIKIRVPIISDVFNYYLIIFCYALICIVVFLMFVLGIFRHDRKLIGWSLMPVLLSLCSPAGSDSGLCLWGWSLFAFIPFIVYIFKIAIKDIEKSEILLMIISLFALACISVVYCREGLMTWAILLILIYLAFVWCLSYFKCRFTIIKCNPFIPNTLGVDVVISFLSLIVSVLTIYAKHNMSFEWVSPKQFTCQHNEEELRYIKTTLPNCKFVDEVMAEYRLFSKSKQNVIFYGFNANVFNYLTKQGSVKGTDFSQDDSPANLAALEEAITNKPVVFLCPCNYTKQNYTLEEYPNVRQMLESYGYVSINKGIYAIFIPSK